VNDENDGWWRGWTTGGAYGKKCEEGTDGSAVGCKCSSYRGTSGKHHSPGKGARSMSTSALEVEHTHPGGFNVTSTARRAAAARGAARASGADIRPAGARKSPYEAFRLKLPYPAPGHTFRTVLSSRRYPPSMVGCLKRYARAIASAHRPRRPPSRVNHNGRVRTE
jgi:hypothetical protein